MIFSAPETMLMLLWFLWCLMAVLAWLNVYRFHVREKRYERRNKNKDAHTPTAVVIIAIKGGNDHLHTLLDGMLTQDYPRYRIIFIVETKQDPTFTFLRDMNDNWADVTATESVPLDTSSVRMAGEEHVPAQDVHMLTWQQLKPAKISPGLQSLQLIVPGLSHNEAQKIHGQRVALKTLTDEDQALVFADADAAMGPDWLERLVQPLSKQSVGLATAWRWIVPADGERANLPTKIAAIGNASTVTLMGHTDRNYAWGGSMAIRRNVADQIDLGECWRGCINDDVSVSRAIKQHGKRLYLVAGMFVISPDRYTWRSLLTFGRRQHLFTKTYAPHVWATCCLGLALYTLSVVATAIKLLTFSSGWGWAIAVLGFVAACDLGRAETRRALVANILPVDAQQNLRGVWNLERFATPLWMAAHLVVSLSAIYRWRFKWGGIIYRVGGHRGRGTRILQRLPYTTIA